MLKSALLSASLFCVIVFVSCSGDKNNDLAFPYHYDTYYPLGFGNKWIYKHSPGTEEQTVIINSIQRFERKEIFTFGGNDVFYFNLTNNKNNSGLFYKRGDLWGSVNGKECLILRADPGVGEKYDLASINKGILEVLSLNEKYEHFNCLKIKYTLGNDYWYYWLSKGFGIVKVYCSFDNSTYEIQSYTLATN